MDLFGTKAKAELTNQLFAREERIRQLQDENIALLRAIRRLDEGIYKMSQCTSWDEMWPHFKELLFDTETRRKSESNRISDIILKELEGNALCPRNTKPPAASLPSASPTHASTSA